MGITVMTKEELNEEIGILDLAAAQLGHELASGRLRVAGDVHRRLSAVVRKLMKLDAAAQKLDAAAQKLDKPPQEPMKLDEPAKPEDKE